MASKLDDIADTLFGTTAVSDPPADVEAPATDVSPSSVADDVSDDLVEDVVEEDEIAPLEGEETEADPEDTLEASHDADTLASEDDESYLDITDEDMFEVKIDGKTEYRSVADAKKALSGLGGIESRLQEAASERSSAMQERSDGIQDLERMRSELTDYVKHIDGFIFQPRVAQPSDALRHSDPSAYLAELDSFNADQARIAHGRQTLSNNVAEQQKQREANMVSVRANNEAKLIQKIPALSDGAQSQAIMQEIVETGRHYGFNDGEIAGLFDHRSFYMAYENAQMRKRINELTNSGTVKTVKNESVTGNTPRRLRSGVAQKNVRAKQKAQVRRNAEAKARSSGKVDDIASLIMTTDRRK